MNKKHKSKSFSSSEEEGQNSKESFKPKVMKKERRQAIHHSAIIDEKNMVDPAILSPKISKIQGHDQFLEKYNIVLHDLDPFINIQDLAAIEQLYYTKKDSHGIEQKFLINSRVAGDEQSTSQKNLRKLQNITNKELERKNKMLKSFAERTVSRNESLELLEQPTTNQSKA